MPKGARVALSRAEKIRLLQADNQGEAEVVESTPGTSLTREQKISLLQGGEGPAAPGAPPPDRLRKGLTFAGSEAAGEAASGLFPRAAEAAAEGKGYGRQVLGAGLDLLSLPGRAAASLGKDKGESTLNSMADTEGDNFVGKVLRDPATGAALLTAPVGGAAVGLTRGLGLGARLGGAATAGALEGTASAAAHQGEAVNQGKSVDMGEAAGEVALNAAIPVGAGLLGAGGKQLLRGAGGLLKMHGEKIATTTIKPSLKDMKDGFRIANVFKHGLEGTLEETQEKLSTKFDDLSRQLSEKIQGSDAKVDLLDVLDEATSSIGADKAGSFGKNSKMEAAAAFLLDEINEVAPDGVVDLATAQKLKRGLGKLGAWEWQKTDPEASAREALANAMYSKLKTVIEKNAPEGVKEINQQLAELIPIERAVVRRMPVEARNQALSLTDVIAAAGPAAGGLAAGGLPGLAAGAAGLAANRARKSPKLAAAGYRLGEKMGGIQAPSGTLPSRLSGRVLSTGYFGKSEEEEQ